MESSRSSSTVDHVAEAAEKLRETIAVGQVYERVPMLCRDGRRFGAKYVSRTRNGYSRVRIVQVPEGRKRTYRYVKVDPLPMGNGRPDRTVHTITDMSSFARHYSLVEIEAR